MLPSPIVNGQGNNGLVLVLTGPSGAGKDTLRVALLERHPDVAFSVSATTRAPRHGEADGVDYHYISREAFQRGIDAGKFIEWAEYTGNLYGTPLEPVERTLAAGRDIVLVIEVQGAKQVRKALPDAVFVFILPSSWDELHRRLDGRGTEDPKAVDARLRRAKAEIELIGEFDYVVINDDVGEAVHALECIREAARYQRSRCMDELARRGFISR